MADDSPPWHHDDPAIADDDLLYRRVPRKPDFYRVPDAVSGRIELTPAAFRYDPDGMSVQIGSLLTRATVPPEQYCSWETHFLARFTPAAPRGAGAGVVASPDDSDPIVGFAHGSVRMPTRGNDRAQWRRIRSAITGHAVGCASIAEVAER